MFKLVAVLLIVGAVAIEARRGGAGGKRPGAGGKQGAVDCSSNTLPDMSDKINSKNCDKEAKVEEILATFQPDNAVLARQLISEVKALKSQGYQLASSTVMGAYPELFAELQSVDPAGYASYNALIAQAGVEKTCAQRVADLQGFYNSLNEAGKVTSRKIACYTMQEAQKTGKAALGQWYLTNANTLTTLRAQEPNFKNLFAVLRSHH